MPTVMRNAEFRFFFYSGDQSESPYVNVEGANSLAKFWLSPVRLEESNGFSRKHLAKVQRIVQENQQHFLTSWYNEV
ncbi:MAG: DUF4160 domain-containing protein [Calditrichaeota bacterium]|nr:MAG: DUF4160 domain-containing protein [Calditrichota bacterium]